MKFDNKKVLLKNNRDVILRSPTKEDSKAMIDYLRTTARETDFMTRYEDEITVTVEQEGTFLERTLNSEKDVMISAFIEGKVIGNVGINIISDRIKLKHKANLGIAIIKEYWNSGLGKVLIEEAIEFAKNVGYEQIELIVAERNKIAKNLYEKFGFETYGVRKKGIKLKDGTYDNDVLMVKYL